MDDLYAVHDLAQISGQRNEDEGLQLPINLLALSDPVIDPSDPTTDPSDCKMDRYLARP